MSPTTASTRPYAVGDRVLLWGTPGVIEHIARSLTNGVPVITVVVSSRIRLRVGPMSLQPAR